MSRLQDQDESVRFLFKTSKIFPIVPEIETRSYSLMGKGEKVSKEVFPLCQMDLQCLREGEYGGIKFSIRTSAENTVLIRHPFRPYEFVPLDTPEASLINDHFKDLADIFSALGAIQCEESAKITEIKEYKKVIKGKATYKTVKIDGNSESTNTSNKEEDLKLTIKRIPAEDAGYERAYNLAQKRNLLGCKTIEDILNHFDPAVGGKDQKYELHENLTEDLHKTLDIVANVNATGVFDFKGEFHDDYFHRKEMRIDKTIYFDEELFKREQSNK